MGIKEALREKASTIAERIFDPNSLERKAFRDRLGEILGEKTEKSFTGGELPEFDFKEGAWPFLKGDVRSVSISQTYKEDGENVINLALEVGKVTVEIESRERSTLSFATLQPGATEKIPVLSARSIREAEMVLLKFGNMVVGLVGAQNSAAKEVPSLATVPLSS